MSSARTPKAPRSVYHLPLRPGELGDFLCGRNESDFEHKNEVHKTDENVWAFLHNLQEEVCIECLMLAAKRNYDTTWEKTTYDNGPTKRKTDIQTS